MAETVHYDPHLRRQASPPKSAQPLKDHPNELLFGLQQTGATLLFLIVFLWCLSAASLVVGASGSRFVSVGLLAATAVLAITFSRRLFSSSWLYSTIIPIAAIIFSVATASLLYDTSIDGQQYHFQAIYAFQHGWNPFAGQTPPDIGIPADMWVSHYPAASWLISAALLTAGLPLESVKCANILALFASGLIVLNATRRLGFAWWPALAFTCVAALNPISLAELFTRMNDGLLASLVLIFIASVSVWVLKDDKHSIVIALAAMLLGLNLKFSAIPIFAILAGAASIAKIYNSGAKSGFRMGLLLMVSGIIGIFVLGANPYLLNWIRFGHPLYPLMGPGSVDIMAGNTPAALSSFSPPARFFYSLFAATHSGYGSDIYLKWPFSLSATELRAAGGVDIRIGGFGPFFSGALLAALLLLPWALLSKRLSSAGVLMLALAAVISISAFVMPQNWWARYVPQFWLVPLLLAGVLYVTNTRWLQISAMCVAAIMFVNLLTTGAVATYLAIKRSAAVSAQIRSLKSISSPLCIDAEYAQSRIAILRSAGMQVHPLSHSSVSPCAEPMEIAGYGPDRAGGKICPCQ